MLGNISLVALVIVIVSILVSLVVHEFMHAYAGHLLGDSTASDEGRLSLNPLKHIDPVMTIALPIITLLLFQAPILAAKPVPFDPRKVRFDEFGAAIIAAAGPLSNLVLAFFGSILANHAFAPGSFLSDAFGIFTTLNVALFVFNLLPLPPLDGSRVLYAFAPEPVQNFMRAIEPFGFLIIFGLVLFAGVGGFLGTLNQYVLNILP